LEQTQNEGVFSEVPVVGRACRIHSNLLWIELMDNLFSLGVSDVVHLQPSGYKIIGLSFTRHLLAYEGIKIMLGLFSSQIWLLREMHNSAL